MNYATWIADLVAHGLIRSSFVPPAPILEPRDPTRARKQLVRRGLEQFLLPACVADQQFERLANRHVIVDNEHIGVVRDISASIVLVMLTYILRRRERASTFVGLSSSKGGVDRLTKSRIAERLQQALHRILPKETRSCGFIRLSGDENDWSFHPTSLQFVV